MLKPTIKVLALLIVFGAGSSAGQSPTPETGAPHMVRAAGMPLNDGTLAPGMLTVRLVEGAFTKDFVNENIEIEVAGGEITSARTGANGRAQFAHLPIGARVRARATVCGERLESDAFEMPAESGVRLLLVASANAGAPLSTGARLSTGPSDLPPNHPPLPATSLPAESIPPPGSSGGGAATIRAVLLMATVFSFGIVLFRRRGRTIARGQTQADAHATPSIRLE